jgi:hypothetical protein
LKAILSRGAAGTLRVEVALEDVDMLVPGRDSVAPGASVGAYTGEDIGRAWTPIDIVYFAVVCDELR